MSREAHIESIEIAKSAIREVADLTVAVAEKRSEMLGLAMLAGEKQNDAIALVSMAVGDDPATHSARNAFEFTAVLGERIEEFKALIATIDERIEELARICDNTQSELDGYANGF